MTALSAHDHLLKRISLTFGGETGDSDHPYSSQKTTALREVTDNAVDEIIAGYGRNIRVTFREDESVEVQDSGRGIPVDVGVDSEGKKVSGIVLALGTINAGGKFTHDEDRFSSGLNGVGAASTMHLSRRADVTVYRNNWEYYLSFRDGLPGYFKGDGPEAEFVELSDYTKVRKRKDNRPQKEKKLFKTGTKIRVWLRDEVFSSRYGIDVDDLIERLKGTAYLVPEINVEVINEHRQIEDPKTGKLIPQHEEFHFEDGMMDLLSQKLVKEQVGEVIKIEAEGSFVEEDAAVLGKDGKIIHKDITKRVPVELVLGWDQGYEYSIDSFVNTIKTQQGGVHERAFERALVNSFNERFRSMRGVLPADLKPTFDDFKEGLAVVLSIKVSEPEFTSQIKSELKGAALQRTMVRTLTDEFEKFVKDPKNYAAVKSVGEKIATATRNRQDAQAARLAKRRANAAGSSGMPPKLADCEIVGEEESELLICEGDSAKGTIVKARDAIYQAVIPIRGKILNGRTAKTPAVMRNQEIMDIGKAIGAGFGEDFDIDKIRYGRIIFAADADHDGLQINNLLYTVFNRMFKPMIEEGRVYQAVSPLYEVTVGAGNRAKTHYIESDFELDKLLTKLKRSRRKYKVSRNKGLGEMEPEVFSETVLNPKTRTLRRITLTDVEKAEQALDLTMGKSTQERKDFMEDNYHIAIETGLVDGFEGRETFNDQQEY